MIELSALDSERFGIAVARQHEMTAAQLPRALTECARLGVNLLVLRCPAADIGTAQAIEAAGGRLMDSLVYYRLALANRLPAAPSEYVRPLETGDAEAIRSLARASFHDYVDHYHADPRLDRAACDEAYASWAHRSCVDPTAARHVLVAAEAGEVLGFLTLADRGPKEREIVLNAVRPDMQRRGIYRALVEEAVRWSLEDRAEWITTSTQLPNLAVQRTWVRAGFEPFRALHTFHLWLDR